MSARTYRNFDPSLSGMCHQWLSLGAVLHSGRDGEDDEPTSVVTELVIDSSGGRRRVKRKKDAGSGGSSASDGGGNGLQLRGSDALQLQRDSQAASGSGDGHQRQKTAAELYAEKQAAAMARALPRDFDWQVRMCWLSGQQGRSFKRAVVLTGCVCSTVATSAAVHTQLTVVSTAVCRRTCCTIRICGPVASSRSSKLRSITSSKVWHCSELAPSQTLCVRDVPCAVIC